MASRIMAFFLRVMAAICGTIAFFGAATRQDTVAVPALIMAALWLLAALIHDHHRKKRAWQPER